jgi:hypothetical protein
LIARSVSPSVRRGSQSVSRSLAPSEDRLIDSCETSAEPCVANFQRTHAQVVPWLATTGSSLGAAAATIFAQAPLDIVRARIFSPKGASELGNANQQGPLAIAAAMLCVLLF